MLAAGDHALFFPEPSLDARFDETVQDLNDDAALFLFNGGIGPRWTGGEIFSNMKAGIVHPLVVELRHPGSLLGHR